MSLPVLIKAKNKIKDDDLLKYMDKRYVQFS